jgi:hypothetical protein
MRKTVEMDLEYLNTIDNPPFDAKSLHKQAASGDDVTINSWRDTWIGNMSKNHDTYGPFRSASIGKMYGEFDLKPCIVAGSGPSLKKNIDVLKDKRGIPLISCLHNFHYMVDHDIDVNYFVTLDAGKITIEEISEGGKHDHEYYLEKTKDYTLCAFVGSDPGLIESWKGKILWFTCPIPDQQCKDEFDKKEVFHHLVSNGGNVLGASIYIAKAYGGANPIALIGADYCFDYTKKFHAWDSKYDGKLGNALRTVDCYGNKVLTWQSYLNFKRHADSIALRVPGEWVNCTEGGIWGVYPEGLIKHIRHKPLREFIDGYRLYKQMQFQAEHPENAIEDTGVPGMLPQPKIFF